MKLRLSNTFLIDTAKEPWSVEGLRVGMFGGPGSGKSWSASLLAEQWLTQGGTVLIFEPRAEYQTLKEKFDVLVIGGPYSKDMDFAPTKPSVYAKALVNDGVSMIFYTSDVETEEKLIDFVSKLISHVLKYNEVVKRPILLIIEEAHEYAPMSARGHTAAPWVYSRMIKSFKDCFLQGRKLNVSTIALSPRPQEVNFTIRQLANLTLYGKFTPQDISYIDRECLKWYRQRGLDAEASKLLDLKTGKWLCILGSKAFYTTVTEPRLTKHGAITPKIEYEAPKTKETQQAMCQLGNVLAEALQKQQEEETELQKTKEKVRGLEKRLASAEEQAKMKLAIKDMLEGGASAEELVEKLAKTEQEIKTVREERTNALQRVDELNSEITTLKEQYSDYEAIDEALTHIVETKIEKRFSRAERSPLNMQPQNNMDIYTVWESKLPSLCAKRILKFLLASKPAKFTKAQLGVSIGYKTSGGTFNGAISFLRQNHLINYDGKYLWTE